MSNLNIVFQCIETLGHGCLAETQMAELLKILDKQLKEHFEREVERLEKRKDEDYDEVINCIFVLLYI